MLATILVVLLMTNVGFAWSPLSKKVSGWQTEELSVGINYDHCPVSKKVLNAAIDKAFALWNEVEGAHIRLSRRNSKTTVAQLISFKAKDHAVILCDPNLSKTIGRSARRLPAIARVYTDSPITYAGVLLNAERGAPTNIAKIPRASLVLTIAHEVGHLLGLGHSSHRDAVMYYSIKGKRHARLSKDDRQGLVAIYSVERSSKSGWSFASFGRKLRLFSRSLFLAVSSE